MPFLDSLPTDATLMAVFKRHPDIAHPLLRLHEAIMRAPSPFSTAEREEIAAFVSSLNDCQYCHGVHSNAAVALGADPTHLEAVCTLPDALPDTRLAPVMRYVAKLTAAPSSVTQSDVEQILDAGWSETALTYAALVAALFAFMNRVVEGHGIKGTTEYHAMGGKRLADIGYAGLSKIVDGAE